MTSKSKIVSSSIRPWNIEPTNPSHPEKPKEQFLYYGKTQLPLRDILLCRVHKESDWDVAGQHFNFMLYVGVSAVFLSLIIDAGWRIQFMIAVAMFLGIAVMSLTDVLTTRKIDIYRVEFETTDGSGRFYTTASGEDAYALISALRSAGVHVL